MYVVYVLEKEKVAAGRGGDRGEWGLPRDN